MNTAKLTKIVDFASMPERSLKGHFYIHKNENAKVIKELDERTGAIQRLAVVAGDAASKKFTDDGDETGEAQRNHILARGMLSHLMAGWKGMAVASAKLYGHITEREAQLGIINQKIGDKSFRTVKEMAGHIKKMIEGANDATNAEAQAFMRSFKVSHYNGQEDRVLEKMEQILNERPKAESGGKGAEEEMLLAA